MPDGFNNTPNPSIHPSIHLTVTLVRRRINRQAHRILPLQILPVDDAAPRIGILALTVVQDEGLGHGRAHVGIDAGEDAIDEILQGHEDAHLIVLLVGQAEEMEDLGGAAVEEPVEGALVADGRDQRHHGRVERPRARVEAFRVQARDALALAWGQAREGGVRGQVPPVVAAAHGRFRRFQLRLGHRQDAQLAAVAHLPGKRLAAGEVLQHFGRVDGRVGADLEWGGERAGEEAGEEDVAVVHGCGGFIDSTEGKIAGRGDELGRWIDRRDEMVVWCG